MEEEERELTSLKNKGEEIKNNEHRIFTGSNSYKNTEVINNEEACRLKFQSISEKESPNLISQSLGINANCNRMKNEGEGLFTKTLNCNKNLCDLNVQSNGRITFSNESNLGVNKVAENNKKTITANTEFIRNLNPEKEAKNENKLFSSSFVSASPHISLSSFNNMANYVRNTFRKKNIEGRKNQHWTYSSHRKYGKLTSGSSRSENHKKDNEMKEELDHDKLKNKIIDSSELITENKVLNKELEKVRKKNGVLKTQIKRLKDSTNLPKGSHEEMLIKMQRLEVNQQKDQTLIRQQEMQILSLQEKMRKLELEVVNTKQIKDEKELLKANFDRIVDVKLKYEKIIKTLSEKPEIKPIIASILEKM